MNFHLQPVQVATGSADAESYLVFTDGFLVAVLVRLSDAHADVGPVVPGGGLRAC